MATLNHFLEVFGMSKITGVVTEIFEGKVQSGRSVGDPFFSVTLDTGEKLTVFGKKGYELIEGIKEGDKATFEVERIKGRDGKEYINIVGQAEVDVAYVGSGDNRADQIGTVPKNTERYYKNKISALQAAVQYVSAVGAGTLSDEDLMSYADKFFEWINQ